MKFFALIAFLFIFFFVGPYVDGKIYGEYQHALNSHIITLNKPFDRNLLSLRFSKEKEMLKFDNAGDFNKAVIVAQDCIKTGSPTCELYYAKALLNGKGINKNEKEGVNTISAYANGGYVDAMIDLSELYQQGLGVEKDLVEASIWLWRAKLAYRFKYCFKAGQCENPRYKYEETETKIFKLDNRLNNEQREQVSTIKKQKYPDLLFVDRLSIIPNAIYTFSFIALVVIMFGGKTKKTVR